MTPLQKILNVVLLLAFPEIVFGMHIAEGFLPVSWAILWAILFIPFFIIGIKKAKRLSTNNKTKLLLAVVGAFVFILSSLKLPSVGGSSSHLTGIALGAILFGASTMSVVGFIVLIFQAILLTHGGLTTLGANAFSMSIIGACSAVWIFNGLSRVSSKNNWIVFLAAFVSNVMIYVCTSFQLAAAFTSETASFIDNLTKFLSVFAITQLPLAVFEGIFTVFAFRLILKYNQSDLQMLNPLLSSKTN